MTPEIVVHHPIPEELHTLLEQNDYRLAASYALHSVYIHDREEPVDRTAAPVLAPVLLRAEEAARLLGLGRTSVFALLQSGELRSVTVGRCRRIPVREIERFVHERSHDNHLARG